MSAAAEYTSVTELQSAIRNNRCKKTLLQEKYAAPLTAAQEVIASKKNIKRIPA